MMTLKFIPKLKTNKGILLIFISLTIFLFTFPKFEPLYGVGLDLSYVWALNYLILSDYDSLITLVYPIGPLGFLKYATAIGNNLIYALLFFSIIKLIAIYFLLKLGHLFSQNVDLFKVVLVWLLSYFITFDFSLIGITIAALLIFYDKNNYFFYFIAILAAVTGIFIKSSIGIVTFSSLFTFFIIDLVVKKDFKRTSLLFTFFFILFGVLGLFIFKSILLLFDYVAGIFYLAGGYSTEMALYPENNWWLLSGFLFSVFLFPFIVKKRNSKIAYILMLLPFFAIWKLAMGREDIYHNIVMFNFLILFWGIIALNTRNLKKRFFVVPAIGILLFYINMKNIPMFNGNNIDVIGLNNFYESVIQYPKFNKKYKLNSVNEVSKNHFDILTNELIVNSSIDIYPWELSYIPANNLNWKPRKTLEIGSSTSYKAKELSAKHFNNIDSPEFVLFHFNKDMWGGEFGSIDKRYILNDEPQAIYNILNNYHLYSKNLDFILFRRNNRQNFYNKKIINKTVLGWNDWTHAFQSDGITRAKVYYKKSILGYLKSFFYKDDAFFIDYKLNDGKIITYRFNSAGAQEGLWVNPLILFPSSNKPESQASAIRLRCMGKHAYQDEIKIIWEEINLNDDQTALSLFGKNINAIQRDTLFFLNNDFESNMINSKVINSQRDSIQFHKGKHSLNVKDKLYSTLLSIQLDSIWIDTIDELTVEADLMYYSEDNSKLKLIISMNNSKDDFWYYANIYNENNTSEWTYVYKSSTLFRSKHYDGRLKIYIYNPNLSELYIDDFKVVIVN